MGDDILKKVLKLFSMLSLASLLVLPTVGAAESNANAEH